MSAYHILTQDASQDTIQVVIHTSIPDVTNDAGISYRVALQQSEPFTESAVYGLEIDDPAEWAELVAGAKYETTETVRFTSLYLDNFQRRNQVEAHVTGFQNAVTTRKQITLAFWGYQGDV